MKRLMLIDASHPEETRVVVAENDRVQEYDVVTTTKKQIKGNIYLAKVTRVEPSLQAAFVDYGVDRQGFLPFAEIHPDYYQIPVADKEALRREAASFNAEAAEENRKPGKSRDDDDHWEQDERSGDERSVAAETPRAVVTVDEAPEENGDASSEENGSAAESFEDVSEPEHDSEPHQNGNGEAPSGVETLSDDDDSSTSTRKRYRFLKRYRIQEVIRRGQVILVQVAKEERGTKGAALTTYISIAGRYGVLMPNTSNAGGISRKIGSAETRRRLKEICDEMDVDNSMSVIIRTAGMDRSKAEIMRDIEYLRRLWDDIREQTLASTAPAMIHEESDVIKRAIRDLYRNDIETIFVDGEEAFTQAQHFMKMLMPSHVERIQLYEGDVPLFHAYDIERQLLSMHEPVVSLRSGGYIVINPTEALVSIDVNSGRATRERNIEETALKTNVEAAYEIARQLRLRDLAGLLVIDFIDMYEFRNRRKVERALKDALRNDRARIQVGRISAFGLLEMSRQRLRPSVTESNTQVCPQCTGSGIVRSVESMAIQLLRALEKEANDRSFQLMRVSTQPDVAFYVLNNKRVALSLIERKYEIAIDIEGDYTMVRQGFTVTKVNEETGDNLVINEKGEILSGSKNAKQTRRDIENETRRPARHGRGPDSRREDSRREDSRRNDSRRDDAEPAEEREAAPRGEENDDEKRSRDYDDTGPDGRRRRGRRGGRRRRGGRGDDRGSYDQEREPFDRQNAENASQDDSQPARAEASPVETDIPAEDAAPQKSASVRGRGVRGGRRRVKSGEEEGTQNTPAIQHAVETPSDAESAAEAPVAKSAARRGTGRGRGRPSTRNAESGNAPDKEPGDAVASPKTQDAAKGSDGDSARSSSAPSPKPPRSSASAREKSATVTEVMTIDRPIQPPVAKAPVIVPPLEAQRKQPDGPKRAGWWRKLVD